MSYATPQQLADALDVRLTDANTPVLQDCLDAAAVEIDSVLTDAVIAMPTGMGSADALVTRVNINRAVEWYKAPATYNGGVGTADIGVMTAPTTGFGRHAAVLYTLTTTGTSGIA